MTGHFIFQLLGTAVAILMFGFGLWKFLVGKIERGDTALHERVSKLQENALMRDEFDKHMKSFEKRMDRIDASLENHNVNINRRFDQLMLSLNALRMSKGQNGE